MRLLQTDNLTVAMGGRELIAGLDWHVHRGEFWCVLGKNGSGKSSLLYTLAGLLPAAGGRLQLAGQAMADMSLPLLARRRGLMQQQHSDAFSHSVIDTVLLGRTPYRIGTAWDADEDREAALSALARTGLSALIDADITRLSGGERQRVALATLLAQAPDLMLMDEPTAHQDVAQQLAIMRVARELTQQHAVVASCHDINLAARFATHVLVLGEGRHWMGRVDVMLTPEILGQAFGCSFRIQGDVLVAE
jgi:iron complex transport system ATP-binding protein